MATTTGVKKKIDRAKTHLKELRETIRVWHQASMAGGMYAATTETTPEGKHEFIAAQLKPAAIPEDTGIMIGDVVHNLRSALDHLFCELATAAGNREECAKRRNAQFPISLNMRSRGKGRKGKALKRPQGSDLLRPEAAKAIEELQPYNRPAADRARDPLWILSELDIIDKHRTVVAVSRVVAYAQVGREGPRGIKTAKPLSNRKDKDGGEIISALLPLPDDHESGRVEHYPQVRMVFRETGCCDDEFVLVTLERLLAEVEKILSDFEARGFFRKS